MGNRAYRFISDDLATVSGCQASHASHTWLQGIIQCEVHGTNATDSNHGRLTMAADNAIIVRRSGHAVDEAACADGNAGGGIEIRAAVAPPCARDHNTEAISGVMMRCTHETRPPAHKRIIQAWMGRITSQETIVDTRFRKSGVGRPLQLARLADDCLRGIERCRQSLLCKLNRQRRC
jgi:hypothetical protein